MFKVKDFKKFKSILWLLVLIVMLGGCINGPPVDSQVIIVEEEVIELEPIYITISAVGDVMMHMPQINAARENNTYDFKHNFTKIAPYIRQSDIAIANLETTFGGEGRGFSGYPMFNSPDELADALKWAGFNVITTINNHTMDTGIKGLLRTIDVLQERNLKVVGTRKSVDEESFILKEVNGVKVGITAYTYETQPFGEFKTLNGIRVPKEAEELIDSFSYAKLDEDLINIKNRIHLMKEYGAEVIIFYAHWGNEYQRTPNRYQRHMAEKLAQFGVDVIFGSHPHVLQPIEIIESEEGRKTLVAYSLGNFISNQRYETLNNRYTEDGMIVTVEIKKDLNNNEITLNNVYYMPTWVYRYRVDGRLRYEVLPVLEYIDINSEEIPSYLTKETLWRINNSKQNTLELIDSESNYLNKHTIIARE